MPLSSPKPFVTFCILHITVQIFPLIIKTTTCISKIIFHCHATESVVKLISSNVFSIFEVISF